jgi:hypothetical protein
MPRPFRVTLRETLDAFWAVAKPLQCYLADEATRYAEGAYTAFLNLVANQVLSDSSCPLTVARVDLRFGASFAECPHGVVGVRLELADDCDLWPDHSDDIHAAGVLEQESIWDAGGAWIGGGLGGVDTSPCTDLAGWDLELKYLSMKVGGTMSEQARSDLTGELTRILPSIIRSVAVVQETPSSTSEDAFVIECKCKLPVITKALLGRNIRFLRRCLDAYFCDSSKKDCMERRIRNAVSLLAESDTQPHDAVGLALAIAAIEALLGEKGESVSERLSGNLAVLLEPDPVMRVKARKLFKDLYGLRSDALHGRQPANVSDHRVKARRVAAAVLHSVISRQDFLLRGGFHPEQPQDLLRDLENLHWSAGQPMGISVLPAVTSLWRESRP